MDNLWIIRDYIIRLIVYLGCTFYCGKRDVTKTYVNRPHLRHEG